MQNDSAKWVRPKGSAKWVRGVLPKQLFFEKKKSSVTKKYLKTPKKSQKIAQFAEI